MADQTFAARGGWPVILGTLMEGGDLDADTARVIASRERDAVRGRQLLGQEAALQLDRHLVLALLA